MGSEMDRKPYASEDGVSEALNQEPFQKYFCPGVFVKTFLVW